MAIALTGRELMASEPRKVEGCCDSWEGEGRWLEEDRPALGAALGKEEDGSEAEGVKGEMGDHSVAESGV
jgi:hypothetical protein